MREGEEENCLRETSCDREEKQSSEGNQWVLQLSSRPEDSEVGWEVAAGEAEHRAKQPATGERSTSIGEME